jgi:hypothetical protein
LFAVSILKIDVSAEWICAAVLLDMSQPP